MSGVRAVAGARHRLAVRPDAVPGRHRLWHQRHQPDRLAVVGGGVIGPDVGVADGGQGDRGAERVQGVALAGQGMEQRRHLGGQAARLREDGGEGAARGGLGELALPEELGHFLERDATGEVADLVAPVVQAPRGAVHRADRRPCRHPHLPGPPSSRPASPSS